MKIKTITIVLGMLLPVLSVKSQQSNVQFQTDYAQQFPVVYKKLLDLPLQHLINVQGRSLHSLYSIQNKMIIVDFWTTSCAACIEHFPVLDSLQRNYNNQIFLLMVSSEPEDKVKEFIRKWEKFHRSSLSMAFLAEDTIWYKQFPHLYLPTYGWISPRYKVLGTASSLFSTPKIIAALLEALVRQPYY